MKLKSAALAFAIVALTPSSHSADQQNLTSPRVVGEGITFVPATNTATTEQTAEVQAYNVRPLPRPTDLKSFGTRFVESLPRVACRSPQSGHNTLDDIENVLCNGTDPQKMAMFRLVDQLHRSGLTGTPDFEQFENAYTRFLNGYNTRSNTADRIERTRAAAGTLYALVSSPQANVADDWKVLTNSWMRSLNDFQYTQPVQSANADNSDILTNRAYYTLQNLATSSEYINLQRALYRNDMYYREDNQQAEAFLNIIKSGRYDRNFQAKVNLSVCASFALVNVVDNLNIRNAVSEVAGNALYNMQVATQGRANQTNCRDVYLRYR